MPISNIDNFCYSAIFDYMNVSLTRKQEQLIQKKLSTGMYASASEVVREGLRLLEERDQVKSLRLAELHTEITKGLSDFESGRVVDGPGAVKSVRRRIRRK